MSDSFEQIIEGLKDEMPDPDPHVNVILADGTVLDFHDVSAKELSFRLARKGYAELADEKGAYCFLFTHGVNAVLARKDKA